MNSVNVLGERCDVDGCDTNIVGLEDGWDYSRGLVCSDCIDYMHEHGHWPDRESDCVECIREADSA